MDYSNFVKLLGFLVILHCLWRFLWIKLTMSRQKRKKNLIDEWYNVQLVFAIRNIKIYSMEFAIYFKFDIRTLF